MTRIIISGANGRMGKAVAELASDKPDVKIVAGFDLSPTDYAGYSVFAEPAEFKGKADVLIDFSSAGALDGLLAYCLYKKLPCVFCTTGYLPEQLKKIHRAAETLPVFHSGNMSLGINLLTTLVKKATAVLGEGFDIEIVERHHRMKVDAPSGTAFMLADAASDALPYAPEYVFDRHALREKRGDRQIGISSVRGGSIVGEHEVIFAGPDEVIELKHAAYSRRVFANGALAAASFLAKAQKPGMYDMNDVLAELLKS